MGGEWEEMSGNAREPGRSTVDRLFALLDVFDGAELTLVQVATRAQLPLTTAYRMLSALENWGGVERDAEGRYRIGLHLWQIGTRASTATGLRETALPLMQGLHESTRENVQLTVRDKDSAVVIERLAGPRSVPTLTQVGGRLPLHATGVGKVLLAHAEPELFPELCAQGLRRHTPYTLIMPGRLAAVLAEVRKSGRGCSREELTLGAASVAVPITDTAGTVRAALGLVVRSRDDLDRYTLPLRAAAQEISRRLVAPASAWAGTA
jgi:DNA-binding IclR family transcriptional regulator